MACPSISWLLAILFVMMAGVVPPVTAYNTMQIINHCPYPIYFWIVGTGWSVKDDQYQYVAPGATFGHPMLDLGKEGSVVLKMRDLPSYAIGGVGIIQAEYKAWPGEGKTWYDLSYIDCLQDPDYTNPRYCPFAQAGMRMYSSKPKADCEPIHCALGGECKYTYLREGGYSGEPSLDCEFGIDVFVETCTDGPGRQSLDPKGGDQTPAFEWQPLEHNPLWDSVANESSTSSVLAPTSAPGSTPAPAPESTQTLAPPESTLVTTLESTEAPVPESTEAPVPESTEAPVPESTQSPTPESTSSPAPQSAPTPASESTAAPAPEYPPQDQPGYSYGFYWDDARGDWVPWYDIQDPELRKAVYESLPAEDIQEPYGDEAVSGPGGPEGTRPFHHGPPFGPPRRRTSAGRRWAL